MDAFERIEKRQFEIKLDYAIEDFDAYYRSFVWKKPEKPGQKMASPRTHVIVGLVLLATGLLATLWLYTLLMGVFEIVLGVLLLISGFHLYRPQPQSCSRWAKRAWKKYQASGQLYYCRFTEDGCWVNDSQSDHCYNYDALEALWEDTERFYLAIPGNRYYILHKRFFTQGAPEEFPAFWEARTGKSVWQVQ